LEPITPKRGRVNIRFVHAAPSLASVNVNSRYYGITNRFITDFNPREVFPREGYINLETPDSPNEFSYNRDTIVAAYLDSLNLPDSVQVLLAPASGSRSTLFLADSLDLSQFPFNGKVFRRRIWVVLNDDSNENTGGENAWVRFVNLNSRVTARLTTGNNASPLRTFRSATGFETVDVGRLPITATNSLGTVLATDTLGFEPLKKYTIWLDASGLHRIDHD
jgi:hypothetical protein